MLLVACCLAATPGAAPRQAVIDEGEVRSFLRELQQGVATDDRAAVSRLVHYPLTVWSAGVRIPIPDAPALLQYYDAVFSPALKDVIARAELPRDGRPPPAIAVTVSASGVSIQANTVTIERVGGQLKVTRLSVPQSPAARGDTGVPSPPPREPKRIAMGLRTVQLAGFLAEGERDSYVIWVDRNQLLEVRITGVREREVVARIVRLETQAPPDARAGDGTRTWIGRIADRGEYRIDVVRLARGREPLAYGLVMRLR